MIFFCFSFITSFFSLLLSLLNLRTLRIPFKSEKYCPFGPSIHHHLLIQIDLPPLHWLSQWWTYHSHHLSIFLLSRQRRESHADGICKFYCYSLCETFIPVLNWNNVYWKCSGSFLHYSSIYNFSVASIAAPQPNGGCFCLENWTELWSKQGKWNY